MLADFLAANLQHEIPGGIHPDGIRASDAKVNLFRRGTGLKEKIIFQLGGLVAVIDHLHARIHFIDAHPGEQRDTPAPL